MTERQTIEAIEKVSQMHYWKTKDKWWLKLVIYTEKRLNETTQ